MVLNCIKYSIKLGSTSDHKKTNNTIVIIILSSAFLQIKMANKEQESGENNLESTQFGKSSKRKKMKLASNLTPSPVMSGKFPKPGDQQLSKPFAQSMKDPAISDQKKENKFIVGTQMVVKQPKPTVTCQRENTKTVQSLTPTSRPASPDIDDLLGTYDKQYQTLQREWDFETKVRTYYLSLQYCLLSVFITECYSVTKGFKVENKKKCDNCHILGF